MSKENKAGKQLSGEELHTIQKNKLKVETGPVVVAVGIENAFNAGSILRCAEAVQAKSVYFIDAVEIGGQKLVNVSRNTSNLVTYSYLTRGEFFQLLNTLPPLIALEITTTSQDIFSSMYPKEVGFVVGAEDKGIPQEYLDICIAALHLPMMGINSSLNVASALCVALYDWHRRYRY